MYKTIVERWKRWWGEQPEWLKVILFVAYTIIISTISTLLPKVLYEFVTLLGVQLIVTLAIMVFALTLSTAYITNKLSRGFDDISRTLKDIAHKMGVESRKETKSESLEVLGDILSAATVEKVKAHIVYKTGIESRKETKSPGYVYVDCRWLRISKEHKDDVHHVYVYCAHPKKPMTREGCPYNCGYLDTSDRKTGAGAFTGLVLGGIAGLPAGPPGVIIGGLLGALAGDMLEVAKPVEAKIRSLRDRGISYELHIDVSKLSGD